MARGGALLMAWLLLVPAATLAAPAGAPSRPVPAVSAPTGTPAVRLARTVRALLVVRRERARLERRRTVLAREADRLGIEAARHARALQRHVRARARLERRLHRLVRLERAAATRLARVERRAARMLPVLLERLRRAEDGSAVRRRAAVLWRMLQAGVVEARRRHEAVREARGTVATVLADLAVSERHARVARREVERARHRVTGAADRFAALVASRAVRSRHLSRRVAALRTLLARARALAARDLVAAASRWPPALLPSQAAGPRRLRPDPTLVAGAAGPRAPRRLAFLRLPPPALLRAAAGPGLALPPVEGLLLARFGEVRRGVRARGLTFAVTGPRPVRAPRAGRVVFAGPFGDWGRVLILDHGDGYHTLIAGAGRLDVDRGARVAAGTAVGAAWPVRGRAGHLYVELRFRGRPIDPLAGVAVTTVRGHSG